MQKCRICGCDDNHACKGGCYWVENDLCSQCFEKMQSYQVSFFKGIYAANQKMAITNNSLILADELPSEHYAEGFVYGYIEAKNQYDDEENLEFEEDPQPGEYYTVLVVENVEDKIYYFFK